METTRFLLIISLGLVLTMIWQAWMEDYGSLSAQKNINKPQPQLNEQYDKTFPLEAETNAPALSVEQNVAPRKAHDIETTTAEKIKVTTDVFDLVINLFSGLAANKKEITINGGDQWRPFIHVSDVYSTL